MCQPHIQTHVCALWLEIQKKRSLLLSKMKKAIDVMIKGRENSGLEKDLRTTSMVSLDLSLLFFETSFLLSLDLHILKSSEAL